MAETSEHDVMSDTNSDSSFDDLDFDQASDDGFDGDIYEPSTAPVWARAYPAQYLMSTSKDLAEIRSEGGDNSSVYGATPVLNTTDNLSMEGPRMRLLKIRPGSPGNTIHLDFVIRQVLDEPPPYKALSYTWGDPQFTQAIEIGPSNASFKVTSSVLQALQLLRHTTQPVLVWIDAISVNQQNLLDRSSQVQIMAQIYNQAEEVVIWLGDVEGIANSVVADRDLFWTLCRQPNQWWKRLWILQECTYAQRCPTVMLGSQRFRLDEMVARWSEVVVEREIDNHNTDRFALLKDNLEHLNTPLDMWRQQVEQDTHRISLLQRLRQTNSRYFTSQHDRLYAILSLVHETETIHFPPDYSKPYDLLCTQVEMSLRQDQDWQTASDSKLMALEDRPTQDSDHDAAVKAHKQHLKSIVRMGIPNRLRAVLETALLTDGDCYSDAMIVASSVQNKEDCFRMLLRKRERLRKQLDVGPCKTSWHTEESDSTCLLNAATNGSLMIIQDLFNEKLTIAKQTLDKAVGEAAAAGHQSIVAALLGRHEVDTASDSYQEALRHVALSGHEGIMTMLLHYEGGDIQRYDLWSLLATAMKAGHISIGEMLISHCKQEAVNYALCEAAEKGQSAAVEWLLNHGANLNGDRSSKSRIPLYLACEKDHTEVANLLIERGASTTMDKEAHRVDILRVATQRGNLELVSILLDHTPALTVKEIKSLLRVAIWKGALQLVELYIRLAAGHGLDIQTLDTEDAVFDAASHGHIEVLRYILELGASGKAYRHGSSILGCMAHAGYTEFVNLLLMHGAEVDARDESAIAFPIHGAAVGGHADTVLLLLQAGATVDIEGGFYGTALQGAAANGRLDAAKVLLNNRAQIDFVSGTYGTALHAAVSNVDKRMVDLLLQRGANVDPTAISKASERGHTDILQALLDHVELGKKQEMREVSLSAANGQAHESLVQQLIESTTT